jgi:hypothetical protein
MSKVYQRTENGTTTHVAVKVAMAEVNTAMMEGKSAVRSMSSGSTRHAIEYKDGRSVTLVLVEEPKATPETDSEGRRIVTAGGKRYVISDVTPARPKTEGAASWIPEAYLSYWAERNGETFGATRHASASSKPGSVGRAVWDAAN